ncbi:hypothetical protein JHK82_024477 [Glycine max]|nr:hypothetical protein JHK85_025072 [Glycine max]KAG5012312.1 hypothetical protein JHK86_024573 [Glycine max]KAG5133289.1 hypothetical protein JHK82_024477 [Glycine max]
MKLKKLVLAGNYLTGRIPDAFYGLNELLIFQLLFFELSSSSLSGSLPLTLGSLTSVLKLDVSNNHLEGNLLNQFAHLNNLTLTDLRNNRFTGGLTLSLQEMSSLEELVLSNNPLGGDVIYLRWENFNNLAILELSNMGLIGEIPESLSELKRLTFVGLSDNNLTGTHTLKFNVPSTKRIEVQGFAELQYEMLSEINVVLHELVVRVEKLEPRTLNLVQFNLQGFNVNRVQQKVFNVNRLQCLESETTNRVHNNETRMLKGSIEGHRVVYSVQRNNNAEGSQGCLQGSNK